MQIITKELPKHKEWRQQILNEITTLKRHGLPGRTLVYGSNATVIARGQKPADVFIGAATLGKGRIILITHDAYLVKFTAGNEDSNIQKLHRNIKKWVTQGTKPENQRKRYIVSDIQPKVGYMHSGYPIVTMMDVIIPTSKNFLFNQEYIRTIGEWGIFHEMGHNMQRNWWTFEGTVEVTCNIFSLKAIQIAVGTSPKDSKWLQEPNFNVWKTDPGIGLLIYAPVIENFRWNVMKRVFTSYETGDEKTYPKDIQGKIDLFWSKMSIEAGCYLSSLLEKWRIPYTESFINQVKKQPKYKQKVDIFE